MGFFQDVSIAYNIEYTVWPCRGSRKAEMCSRIETEDLSSGVQLAAKHRGLAVVKLLLDNGADVNYRPKSSIKTALHGAVHRGSKHQYRPLIVRSRSIPELGIFVNPEFTIGFNRPRLSFDKNVGTWPMVDQGRTAWCLRLSYHRPCHV